MRSKRHFLALALTFATRTVFAQTALSSEDEARRREIIQHAEQTSATGDHPGALELLERAGRMRMSPSLRRFIAEEQNAMHQSVRALGSAQLCIRDLAANPTAPNRDADLAACRQLVASLEPRIAHVTIRVPSSPPAGLHVRVGGSELSSELWGLPSAVDPGTVDVVAEAPDMAPFHREVPLRAGESTEVVVSVVIVPHATAPVQASSEPPRTEIAHAPIEPPVAQPSPRTPVAIALGVVGIAGLGLGVVATILRENAAQSFNGTDANHPCSTTVATTADCASFQSTVNLTTPLAITGYAVGGALVVTAAVLLLTAPNSSPAQRAAATCDVTWGGVACSWRF